MKKTSLTMALAAATLLLAACGKNEAPAPAPAPAPAAQAPAPAPTPAPAPAAQAPAAAPATAENTVGKSVFGKTCAMCHAAGVAGAPKPGDKADWAPRIAQGKDTLYKHAIEGFTGPTGSVMPAKGGNPALTDEQVKATVDWMLANLK